MPFILLGQITTFFFFLFFILASIIDKIESSILIIIKQNFSNFVSSLWKKIKFTGIGIGPIALFPSDLYRPDYKILIDEGNKKIIVILPKTDLGEYTYKLDPKDLEKAIKWLTEDFYMNDFWKELCATLPKSSLAVSGITALVITIIVVKIMPFLFPRIFGPEHALPFGDYYFLAFIISYIATGAIEGAFLDLVKLKVLIDLIKQDPGLHSQIITLFEHIRTEIKFD